PPLGAAPASAGDLALRARPPSDPLLLPQETSPFGLGPLQTRSCFRRRPRPSGSAPFRPAPASAGDLALRARPPSDPLLLPQETSPFGLGPLQTRSCFRRRP